MRRNDPDDALQAIAEMRPLLDKIKNKQKDALDSSEIDDLEKAKYEESIKDMQSRRSLREKYANRILFFLYVYVVGAWVLLVCNGFSVYGFHLDDNILITLAGSTTVSAIGLVGFVVRGLFGPRPDNES